MLGVYESVLAPLIAVPFSYHWYTKSALLPFGSYGAFQVVLVLSMLIEVGFAALYL